MQIVGHMATRRCKFISKPSSVELAMHTLPHSGFVLWKKMFISAVICIQIVGHIMWHVSNNHTSLNDHNNRGCSLPFAGIPATRHGYTGWS